MKFKLTFSVVLIALFTITSCVQKEDPTEMSIVFLHHSTGHLIWTGNETTLVKRIRRKLSENYPSGELPALFKKHNKEKSTSYQIKEMTFPKSEPYGWNNFPFDYYNIWVKNAGENPFMEEPTLEILAKEYQVIIFKHCFPVSNIQADQDSININSDLKTISNYKLQYQALKDKLHEFPETKFILFTGAIQIEARINNEEAKRTKEFFDWVRYEWDQTEDNIYLWDLYSLQTEGGLYFKDEYAKSQRDSHPNDDFASNAVKLLFNRIIDVIENDGSASNLTGEGK